jgi:phosphate transport system ATP-binding protein
VVTDEQPIPSDPTASDGDPMTTTASMPPTTTSAEVAPEPVASAPPIAASPAPETVVSLRSVSFFYGSFRAVKEVTFDVPAHQITSLIGPSGSGKSTLLRTINRMNDLISGTRLEGEILYRDENLYASYVDPVEVRRRIGMVFQKANPFPKSIFDNVAFGPRVNGIKGNLDDLVEASLRRAALWFVV